MPSNRLTFDKSFIKQLKMTIAQVQEGGIEISPPYQKRAKSAYCKRHYTTSLDS